MNKSKLILIAGLVTAISFQSCNNRHKIPENPRDGQEYVDDRDNVWTWNQAMGYWMIMSNINSTNSTPTYHYYYPSTNRWTNSSGYNLSSPPKNVSTKTSESLNSRFTEKSYKSNSNSSSSKSVKSGSTSTSKSSKSIKSSSTSKPKSGGFGTSSKSSFKS